MRKLTVKTRLLILTLAVAVVSLGIGAAGLVGVSNSIQALQQMYEGRAKALQAISTINELVTEASFSVSDAILDPSAQKTQLVASGTAGRIEQVDGLMKQYVAGSESADEGKRAEAFASIGIHCEIRAFNPLSSCSMPTTFPKHSGCRPRQSTQSPGR